MFHDKEKQYTNIEHLFNGLRKIEYLEADIRRAIDLKGSGCDLCDLCGLVRGSVLAV